MLYSNEDKQKEQRAKISRRVQLLFTIVFLFFAALVLRLSIVQITNGEDYLKMATEKSIQNLPIPAPRGKILDKSGKILVDNKVSYTAVFREEEGMTKDYILGLAARIAPILNIPKDEIVKKMDSGYNTKGERVIRKDPQFLEKDLKFDLSTKEIAIISEHRSRLRGIDVVVKPVREYSPDQVAVQAIGFVRPFASAETSLEYYKNKKDQYLPNQAVGMDGVEYSYENLLMGQNGTKELLVNAKGALLEESAITQPKPGSNLYLSFDKRMQLEVRNFIANYLTKLRENPKTAFVKNAYAVAIETRTGKIAAIVSYPEYDPNNWVKGVDDKVWQNMQYSIYNGTIRSAPYDARPGPYEEVSKHASSVAPIGSVIKPLTVLMGLNEQIIAPDDTWQDEVFYKYGKGTDNVHNASDHDYGLLTPQRALQKSANTYMARIADLMVQKEDKPLETFRQYHHNFGLGIRTGVDLPFEDDGIEDYVKNSKRISTLSSLVQAAFGQQERYTTMQLADYAATLANKGKRLQPQIVDRIETNKIVKTVPPKILSTASYSEEYWNVVNQGMRMVTQPGGTAAIPFDGFPYPVAAKTGTSEQDIYVKGPDEKWHKDRRVENASFIGFAPADKPKLAVAVVVPEGGFGTNSASYIGRAIFDLYNKYVGLGD
jgi:penicillin-binding protein 2